MKHLDRITFDPMVMGGKPCIRGMRVTAGMIVGLIASGYSNEAILKAYKGRRYINFSFKYTPVFDSFTFTKSSGRP